jgi:response regulator RpfG family c-di-GMP phosphodiesterase
VDDENIVLQSIKTELFSQFGDEFIIETAESGPEALKIFEDLRQSHYDISVIISDYIMPGMKGDELLQKIHQISPQSKTILLTGQAKIEGITNAINHANLFHYLEKPWKKDALKEIICSAVSQYRQSNVLAEEHSHLSRATDELKLKIQEKITELNGLREKLAVGQNAGAAGQLTKNLLLFEEINTSLNKIKANMDRLVEQQASESRDGSFSSPETQERFYRSNQEEIRRITSIIQRLRLSIDSKEGQL